MELLIMVNNEVIPNPHVLQIKEFAAIWNSDKSKDKEEAKRKLSCIVLFCKSNSIYSRYNPEEREVEVAKDVLGTNKFSKDITLAIAKYNSFKTVTELYLESQINAMNKSLDYYNNVDYTERDDKGQPVYKIKEVQSSMKESKGIIATIKDLQEQLKKEQEGESDVRGGVQVGQFAK